MIPVSGSAYAYSYATLGEGIAWFIGWNLILEYLFAVATVSVGWSGYVLSLLDQFRHPPAATRCRMRPSRRADRRAASQSIRTGAILNVPAVRIVAAIATICYIGIKQSSAFNSVIVAIKVTVVLLFVFLGVGYIQHANWHPFIPPNTGQSGVFGLSGVFAASGVDFLRLHRLRCHLHRCAGDEEPAARHADRHPRRAWSICTVLYVAVSLVLTGMVSYTKLDVSAPLAVALDAYRPLRWLRSADQARRHRRNDLGHAGDDPGAGAHLPLHGAGWPAAEGIRSRAPEVPHAFRRAPWSPAPAPRSSADCSRSASWASWCRSAPCWQFVTVCIGVLVLRYTRPDLPRPFRAPWPWLTCIAGAAICFADDVLPARQHLDTPCGLDADRRAGVRVLRLSPQQGAQQTTRPAARPAS